MLPTYYILYILNTFLHTFSIFVLLFFFSPKMLILSRNGFWKKFNLFLCSRHTINCHECHDESSNLSERQIILIRRYVTSCTSSLLYCFGVRGVTIINLGVRATLIYRVFLSVNRRKYELKTMILSFNLYAEFY